jgi:voltage-gated potassium channel
LKEILEESTVKKIRNKIKLLKLWLYNILENPGNSYNNIYNLIAMFIVITSSLPIILEWLFPARKIPPDLKVLLDAYIDITLWFFVIEYLIRWWIISDFNNDFRESYERNRNKPKLERIFIAFWDALKPKIKWMLSFYAIIDLLAILPVLRPLRAIRILLLLRLLKVFRYYTGLKMLILAFKEHAVLFLFIFILMLSWIVIFSVVIYVVEYNFAEKGNNLYKSVWDAIYWGIVTTSTVGYGDIYPHTSYGKLLTAIMIIGGIVLVSAMTGIFSATLISRLMKLKEGNIELKNLENHIVICGWNETAEEIVSQIIQAGLDKERPVVIITQLPKEKLDIKFTPTIFYKNGDFIHENTLLEAGIDKAKDIVVVAEREEGLTERNIDARTALVSMLIRTLNPNANLYVEVLLDEDAQIFQKRMNIQEIIIHGQILGKIMFASIVNPGLTSLINRFVEKENRIKKLKVSKLGDYKTFGEVLREARKYNYLAIGVDRKGEIIINPSDSFKLKNDDYIFLIPSGEE